MAKIGSKAVGFCADSWRYSELNGISSTSTHWIFYFFYFFFFFFYFRNKEECRMYGDQFTTNVRKGMLHISETPLHSNLGCKLISMLIILPFYFIRRRRRRRRNWDKNLHSLPPYSWILMTYSFRHSVEKWVIVWLFEWYIFHKPKKKKKK